MPLMKKILKLLFASIILIFFEGCASTPSSVDNEISSPSEIKNKQEVKKLRSKEDKYDNWQYKGFGQDLPEWVEILLSDSLDANKKLERMVKYFPEIESPNIAYVIIDSDNLDQAENQLKERIDELYSEYHLCDKFWVRRKSDKTYFSTAVLWK